MKSLRVIHAVGLCFAIGMSARAQVATPRAGGPRQPVRMGTGARPQATTPTLLLGPADWRFERMPLPPGFAPDMKFSGFEEIRFAPGMFDTTSANYFTYILALSVDGTGNVDAAGIKDFLEKYYRGLLAGVGRRKGLTADPSQINAEIAPAQPEDKTKGRCQGKVALVDTFTDGRKISVNVEADVLPQPASNKTFIILLLSPQPPDSEVWKNLRTICDKTRFEGR